jgi:hypothetical protein
MATRMGSPRTVTWSCPQLHAASRSGMWITFRARPQLDWHPFESTVFVPQDARRELPQIVAEIRQAPLSRPGEASRAAILCANLTSTPAGRCASKATLLCHGCKKASIKAAMAAIDRNCSLNVELHDAGAGESLARQGTGRAPNAAHSLYLDMVGVRGSIPLAPTIPINHLSIGNAGVFGHDAIAISGSPIRHEKANGRATRRTDSCETRAATCGVFARCSWLGAGGKPRPCERSACSIYTAGRWRGC